MMTYREWMKNKENLFLKIEELQPSGIVETIGSDVLSSLYFFQYGDRPIPSKLEDMTTSEVASLIHSVYVKRWTKLFDLAEEVALFNGFDSEVVIEEINLDNYSKSILTENVDSVTAFDSEVLSTSGSEDNALTETNDLNKNKQFTKKERDIKNIDIRQNMIDNSNVITIICEDVSNLIALKIY